MAKTVGIIQARMTSTRLPGKVLMKIDDTPILLFIHARLKKCLRLDELWVATSDRRSDDVIAELCRDNGISVHRGSEHDVLGRYHGAAQEASADIIVRITADCPFIDPQIVDEVVLMMMRDPKLDYASNTVLRTFPDGLDAEAFTHAALDIANSKASDPFDREHVTPFINGNSKDSSRKQFNIGHYTNFANFENLRWTVDTQEDLEHVKWLASAVPNATSWLDYLVFLAELGDKRYTKTTW